ncbi:MAG: DUF115 domain-containing protein [Treponema sp.]|nr:DUF115 domain-containing protein [Treponema sp.]
MLVNKLHSRYNPQAEAERYIDSLNLNGNIECFILIEPGFGYLVSALQKKFKDSKIIVLHADDSFPPLNVPEVRGTETFKVQDFLEREVPETDAENIKIIEWRPSMNFYKQAYVSLLSFAVDFIKRMDAGKRTAAVFGKKWVGNFFRNIGNARKTLLYKSMDIPVIITGAGPSLEKAIPVIKKAQEECLIISASSSLMALSYYGVRTDIVISTDGGGWALRHIYPFFRKPNCAVKYGASFAVNLCAALPSQCAGIPFLIMNDGSLWQSVILHELSMPSVIIPQKGTVTACAVELALALTNGNIFLAGMDLSVRDIKSHVRPYAFDHLLLDNASRFTPVYSQSFVRSKQIQEGGSLDIYAGWFKKQLASWPKRIFSFGGGNEIFESAHCAEQAKKKNTSEYFKTVDTKDDPANFLKTGVRALISALKNGEYAENLKKELAPLLFPSEKNITERQIETAINEAAYG